MTHCKHSTGATHHLENNPNHQAARRAGGNVLAVLEVEQGNLKLVAARARVGVDLAGLVPGHVLDLDLVVDGNLLVVGHFLRNE